MANAVLNARIPVADERDVGLRQEAVNLLKRIVLVGGLLVLTLLVMTQRHSILAAIDHPIDKIQVSGAFEYLEEGRVNKLLGSLVGQGFFSVDLEMIKAEVEALPWVASATVSRVWPGQISLFVTEQEAVGVWNGLSLINPLGVTFSPEEIPANLRGLPSLIGSENFNASKRTAMFEMFQMLQAKLTQSQLSLVSLELNARNAWEMTLSNGVGVALGSMDAGSTEGYDKLNAKVERVASVFKQKSGVDVNKIKRIDARYPNGVAIKWHRENRLIASKQR